ncbi:LPS-assembly protein LptD [Kushneria phosphatilytica]|uniref:LPS-assembly protein LptD n=1 Tax=Kushneria phosphatilytica TaxID=657387 RepID=UPI0008D9F7D8|nr:LPS-assembly protein LptD [Kushneria phosphatilytica]OHV12736.1 LPS biosynthesis protein [Kushneria phosphatilytica]
MGQRLFWTAASLTGLLTSIGAQAAPEPLPADQLDWQPWGADRPGDALCRGHYVMPEYRLAPGKTTSQIRSSADNADYGLDGQTILNGDVVLRRGDQQVEDSRVTVNKARTQATLDGPLTWRRPGVLVRGSDGQVSLVSDAAHVDQAHYVVHDQHIRGDADRLARLKDGRYRLTSATYTSCDPQSSLWKIVGSDVTLNREKGYGTATNARLEVEDVPVFYWPWVRFPIDDRRQSGFLWPTVGFSGDNGLDYAQPYYLNLAPNYDATITPRYMVNRGAMLGGQFRYLIDENNAGFIEGNYLPDDQQGTDEDNGDDLKGEDRWLFRFAQNGQLNDRTLYNLRYGAASDGNYFDDFGQTFGEKDTDNLERLARIDYAGSAWHLQARARGYQKMDYPLRDDDKPFYELPALIANGSWRQDSGLYEEWNTSAINFWRDVEADNVPIREAATGTRLNLAPAIGYRRSPSWGFFEPRMQLMYTQYDLDWHNRNGAEGRDDTPDRTVPIYSVDSGLIFERETSFFGDGYRQTLEPRLYYAYVPYRDQSDYPEFDTDEQPLSYGQLWSPFRFSGIDRIGDVNKVSYGVASRFLEDDTGRERLALSIGQSHYFENRRVVDAQYDNLNDTYRDELDYRNHRDESPVIGQLDWQITDAWSARQALFYDTHRDRTEKSASYLRYHDPEGGLVLNLGYRWEVEGFDPSGDNDDRLGYNRDEYDVSFAWKATPGISLLGRYLYDQTNSRSLEKLAGIRFDDCCYGVEVAWREWVDDDDSANTIEDDETKRGIFLRFVLKGLGGLGTPPDSYYADAIPGYRPDRF